MGTALQKKILATGVGRCQKVLGSNFKTSLVRAACARNEAGAAEPAAARDPAQSESKAQNGLPELTSGAHARTPGKPRQLLEATAGSDDKGAVPNVKLRK